MQMALIDLFLLHLMSLQDGNFSPVTYLMVGMFCNLCCVIMTDESLKDFKMTCTFLILVLYVLPEKCPCYVLELWEFGSSHG